MIKEHILQTISLAHYYNSAFDRDQLYKYLRVKINRADFEVILNQLIQQRIISENKGFLFQNKLQTQHEQQQQWSREILKKYQMYIKMIAKFPSIKFIGLTGSNAFESCNKDDDLDIFIICKQYRLWICYSYIVMISLLFRKRSILCVNYLVDENNLKLSKGTYYTAVQLVQMLAVYNRPLKKNLISENPWLVRYLPNFEFDFRSKTVDCPYISNGDRFNVFSVFMKKLNRFIFEKYNKRIVRKFPDYIGTSMIMTEGVAKLHHVDHHDTYDEINSTETILFELIQQSEKYRKL